MISRHNIVIIDAHAHFRECFNIVKFLGKAYRNFAGVAQDMCFGDEFIGVLFVADPPGENGFVRLLRHFNTGDGEDTGGWFMQNTREATSVQLRANGGKCLVIVAGRQINSREELEVLAAGTRREFDEGRPVSELIPAVVHADALPIIPWGVGKWLGRRGQLVRNLIESSESPSFFLGDSANRPSLWPRPLLFEIAEEWGIRNLPGSDPLPFPDEVHRVGSYGVALEGRLDLETPTRSLKERLLNPSTTFHPFGEPETPLRFVRNQLKMQLRKLTH